LKGLNLGTRTLAAFCTNSSTRRTSTSSRGPSRSGRRIPLHDHHSRRAGTAAERPPELEPLL